VCELVLERDGHRPWLPVRPNQHYRARVKSLNPIGDSTINDAEMILTVTNSATNHLSTIRAGSVVEISTTLSKNLGRATTAIGGGPLLIADGKVQARTSNARKNIPRHPRTAVGYNRRYMFLVEVDGRQPELSMGMNLEELAGLMSNLGCTDAMNLDGGGSSTFWLEGKVMNSPSDKHERTVANALMVVKKK
jgi:exopolysaccharide biosynthesis protein